MAATAAWVTLDEVRAEGTPCATIDEAAALWGIEAASGILFQKSGRRWPGLVEDTVAISGDGAWCWPRTGVTVTPDYPLGHYGADVLVPPGQPVLEVVGVTLNGAAISLASVRILDGVGLVRMDGLSWPSGDPLAVPPPIEVEYVWGGLPPDEGRLAAAALACELARARTGDDHCQLNRRVRQIARQGTTVELALPGLVDALRDGRFGIPEVDAFLAAHNPAGLQGPPVVVVPGDHQPAYHRLS